MTITVKSKEYLVAFLSLKLPTNLVNSTPIFHQNELVANYWKLYSGDSPVFSIESAQKIAC